ncbi:hypothetical protein [Neokomagataea thailandica]|uniref:hypothetical protein n=1 Tax=Neokomagataea TaxID=1223423 RepID=UPI000835309D|nr:MULTISPECIES: hypothetical protein [Neokomagataea]
MTSRTTRHITTHLRPVIRPLIRTLLVTSLLASAASFPAYAAHITMSGEDLDLTVPCSGTVHIIVDPSMKDGATLDSSNATQVMLRTGKDEAESRITVSTRSCAPAGRLTISVSPITGISIHDSHDTRFTITGKLASLDASLDSNALTADNIQSLDLSMRGTSSVHIGTLDRAAQIVASGNTSFTADHANLTAFSAQLTNSATLNVAQGTIEALTLVTADNASAALASSASLATITANGTGTVDVAQVNGPVVRSGTGTVHVGDSPPSQTATPPAATPTPTPSKPPQTATTITAPTPSAPIPPTATVAPPPIIVPPAPPQSTPIAPVTPTPATPSGMINTSPRLPVAPTEPTITPPPSLRPHADLPLPNPPVVTPPAPQTEQPTPTPNTSATPSHN